MEPLACIIRKDKYIKGIQLPDPEINETKLNICADDTQLLLRTENSIKEEFKSLALFEKASGFKINYRKTYGMNLGTWKGKVPKFTKINWTNDSAKTLGTEHGHNIKIDKIWSDKISKIKKLYRCLENEEPLFKWQTLD